MAIAALCRALQIGMACLVLGITPGLAQAPKLEVTITYLGRDEPQLEPLSLAQPILTDEGWKGIEQGIAEAGVAKVEPAELDAMMKHYDVNKDGRITRWEAERVIDLPVPEAH